MLKPQIDLTKIKKNSVETVTTKIWFSIQSRTEDYSTAYRRQQLYVEEIANCYECVDDSVCVCWLLFVSAVLLRTLQTPL